MPDDDSDDFPADIPDGLTCPVCGCRHFRVVWTRARKRGILRARECRNCQKRIQTYEKSTPTKAN